MPRLATFANSPHGLAAIRRRLDDILDDLLAKCEADCRRLQTLPGPRGAKKPHEEVMLRGV